MSVATPVNLFTCPPPDRIRNQGFLIKLFLEIKRLTHNREHRAFCSNAYLATRFECSIDKISRALKRLESLGAIALEQVVGIRRYIRVKTSLEGLKKVIFPGHESNWRESAPDPKPAARRRMSSSPTFSPPHAETIAETVAEGQYRETPKESSLQTLPTGEGQQTEPQELSEALSVAVSLLKNLVSPYEALGLAREALKQGRTLEQLKRIVSAFKSQIGNIRNPGAWLRSAIRDNYAPPAPTATHASDRGERPQNTVQPPREEIERRKAEEQARQAHQDAQRAAWEGLNDTQRRALLEAQAELVRRSGGPADRDHLRKRGLDAMPVVMPARRSFTQAWDGLTELDSPSRIEQAHQLALKQLLSQVAPQGETTP